jgi:PAS domain S-box-containing protein
MNPLWDLPIATYLVAEDGTIIEGNRRFREMLGLRGSLSNVSLGSFYKDHQQRAELLRRAREASQRGRWLEKATAVFSIDGHERWVQVFCGVIQPRPQEELFLGCLVDVTEEETLKELLDRLPVGLFQVRPTGEVIQANPVLARLLGYERQSQVLGRSFADFLSDPKDFAELCAELEQQA